MRRVSGLLLVVGALSGCAGNSLESPWLIQREMSQPPACTPLTREQELAINLSQQMQEAGNLHAALANLERLPPELPEARLRKARILRVLGRPEAQALYQGLLGTCLLADAHHGLGQLAAGAGRYPEAVEHLKRAVSLSPTNDAMRNDLGVVYLNLRQLPQARFELTTALELNEGDARPAENLLTLLIYENRWTEASALVTRRQMTPAQFREAEQRAQQMRRDDQQAAGQAPAAPAPAPKPAALPAQPQPQSPAAMPAPTPAMPQTVPVPARQIQQPVRTLQPAPAPQSVRPALQPQPSAVLQAPRPAQSAPQVAPMVPRPAQTVPQPALPGQAGGVQRVAPAAARPVVPITRVQPQQAQPSPAGR